MDARTAGGAKSRRRSKVERRRIVEETLQPGAAVAAVARAHGVRATQVYHWRKLYRAGKLDVKSGQLLPVRITDGAGVRGGSGRLPARAVGTIDVDLGHARVRIDGMADPDCVRAALEGLVR